MKISLFGILNFDGTVEEWIELNKSINDTCDKLITIQDKLLTNAAKQQIDVNSYLANQHKSVSNYNPQ
jgi:hypothetical protein